MFFLGIFGLGTKQKTIPARQAPSCPLCGAAGHWGILKEYRYLHLFFVPFWRFKPRYYLKSGCCGQIKELPLGWGERLERGEPVPWEEWEPKAQRFICPACARVLDPNYKYCPHCGKKLL